MPFGPQIVSDGPNTVLLRFRLNLLEGDQFLHCANRIILIINVT